MKHVEIVKDSIYLSVVELANNAAPTKPEPTNHIWVIDRSGSMSGLLYNLVDDLISKSREVKVDDTVSIGWFSSEGEYDWAIKGFRVTGERDYDILDKALNKLRQTVGMTCFSEILANVDTVIEDLRIFANSFAFTLFTDGYPVVSNYSKETDAIFAAVEKIGSKLTSSLLVGYGHYYNKELMTKMAEKIGGSLIHSSSLAQFSTSMTEFIDKSFGAPRVVVNLKADLDESSLVFFIDGKFVTAASPNPKGEVAVPSQTAALYVVTKGPLPGSVPAKPEEHTAALYAAALLLTQRAKTDQALEFLGALGDKGLIDNVYNSYSHEEYGKVEENLLLAVNYDKSRFVQGKKSGYLPKADAFCLLDLLDLLDSSYFYPMSPGFRYQRIGKAQERDENYPKFSPDPATKTQVGSLTWNETKLNLSVLTKIQGTVELTDREIDGKTVTPESVGLSKIYPTSVWRNFAIVKDGNLNVQTLPISMPEDVFAKLREARLVDDREWEADKVYDVHIDRIPIVNRAIANGRTSASALADKVLEEHKLKGLVKALKWLRDNEVKRADPDALSPLNELQRKLLTANGLDPIKNLFSPPTTAKDSTDFYMAKTFDIKVAGLSSLPKVEDAINKVEGKTGKTGAKPSKSELLVYAGVEAYRQANLDTMPDLVKESWLTANIDKLSNEMRSIRRYVQETKFAVILGKKWFDEFKSRDEKELTLGDYKFTFQLGEQKVNF